MVDQMEQLAGSKILVAERDAATRRRLTQILSRDALDVEALDHPEDLLQKARATTPDLVIVDVRMPAATGFDVVRKLRRGHPGLPILVLLPARAGTTIHQAIKLGATDFLQKPIDATLLLRRVEQCLSTVQLHRLTSARRKAVGTIKGPTKLAVPLPHLHDRDSGRVDAKKVAEYLGVPLAKLAPALGAKYRTLFKTPSAETAQEALRSIKRVLTILSDMIGDQPTVRVWLNSPHADLGMRTPVQVMLEGHVDAVLRILENALEGIPA